MYAYLALYIIQPVPLLPCCFLLLMLWWRQVLSLSTLCSLLYKLSLSTRNEKRASLDGTDAVAATWVLGGTASLALKESITRKLPNFRQNSTRARQQDLKLAPTRKVRIIWNWRQERCASGFDVTSHKHKMSYWTRCTDDVALSIGLSSAPKTFRQEKMLTARDIEFERAYLFVAHSHDEWWHQIKSHAPSLTPVLHNIEKWVIFKRVQNLRSSSKYCHGHVPSSEVLYL